MNKRERVYAALEGAPVDRVPISIWRHFHKQNQTPTGLASSTLAFYKRYDFDFIKITPSSLYAIKDWGAQIVFSKDDEQPSYLKKPLITKPDDWRDLTTLSGLDGTYGQILETIKLIKKQLTDDDVPLLMTIRSPLTIAYQMAEELLFNHLDNYPTDVHIGLATIAETICRFANVALEVGADGIFFFNQLASADLLSEKTYQTFAVCYDLIALEQVKSQPAPLVLHLQGEHVFFESVNQYPVHAISWNCHRDNVSIKDALNLTDKTLVTGLTRLGLEKNTPEEVMAQVEETISQTDGRRLILAPPGPISSQTPDANLQALKKIRNR